MTPCIASILPLLEHNFKSRVPVCTHCGCSAGCSKWCCYRRIDPHTDRLVSIQRYLCPNEKCLAVTFSIPPFGFLPFLRISFGALWVLGAVAQFFSVNALSKMFDCSRSTIRRRVIWIRAFVAWLEEHLVSVRGIPRGTFHGMIFARFFPHRWLMSGDQHNLANVALGADSVR